MACKVLHGYSAGFKFTVFIMRVAQTVLEIQEKFIFQTQQVRLINSHQQFYNQHAANLKR